LARERYTLGQIVTMLGEAEVLLSKGSKIEVAASMMSLSRFTTAGGRGIIGTSLMAR